MPIVYENEGHAKRMSKMYPQFQFKMTEWRKNKNCRLCGRETHIEAREGTWKGQATVDHVLAQGLGGADEESNWALICSRCNNRKSRVESELKDLMDFIMGRSKKRNKLLDNSTGN